MGKPASEEGGDRAPVALAMWILKERELELGLEKKGYLINLTVESSLVLPSGGCKEDRADRGI